MAAKIAAGLKFTPYFFQRAGRKRGPLKDFSLKLGQEMLGKWGEAAVGKATRLLTTQVETVKQRLIFTALAEVATGRYATLAEFEARNLSLNALAQSASEIAARLSGADIPTVIKYLKGEAFIAEAQDCTEGEQPFPAPQKSPIVTVNPEAGEEPPSGFNREHPNSLFFNKDGSPGLIQWDLPALGYVYFGGERLYQRIIERGDPLREGAVIIAPRRSQRPQPAASQEENLLPAKNCTLCNPADVAGPHLVYANLTPQEWLEKGPRAALMLASLEHHEKILSYSGRNPFAFAMDHRMVLHDAHADTLSDLTPAMIMALYHGADLTMLDILKHFQSQGIDQVTAGQNFGTADFRFPAGASFKHPHIQVGAVHKDSFHASNALARRVERYRAKGIDFMGGYLDALRKAGLVFYENKHVAAFAPFAPFFKDELQIMMKRPGAGNPLSATEEERNYRNFAIALSILGLRGLMAPGKDGAYVPVGIGCYNSQHMGRRTNIGQEGQREVWTISPRQTLIAFSELSGRFVVDRDPTDTAEYMERTLNILMLTQLLENGAKMDIEEVSLLAEFATRKPGLGRLYELDAPAQFNAVPGSINF